MAKIDTQKIIAPIMKFVNMRGIIALKDGMLAILPLTVVGSLFLIVGLPILKASIRRLLAFLGKIGPSHLCRFTQELLRLWV